MKCIYTKLALYGSKSECAKTDNVLFPISEICNSTVCLRSTIKPIRPPIRPMIRPTRPPITPISPLIRMIPPLIRPIRPPIRMISTWTRKKGEKDTRT